MRHPVAKAHAVQLLCRKALLHLPVAMLMKRHQQIQPPTRIEPPRQGWIHLRLCHCGCEGRL